jgi:hypothetical protein
MVAKVLYENSLAAKEVKTAIPIISGEILAQFP